MTKHEPQYSSIVGRPVGRLAYAVVLKGRGFALGIAEEDVAGFSPFDKAGTFKTDPEARTEANRINAEMGLSETDAISIITSSIKAQLQDDKRSRRKKP